MTVATACKPKLRYYGCQLSVPGGSIFSYDRLLFLNLEILSQCQSLKHVYCLVWAPLFTGGTGQSIPMETCTQTLGELVPKCWITGTRT